MIPEVRASFNSSFDESHYQALLEDMKTRFDEAAGFRISETPVFISKEAKEMIFSACDAIIEQIGKLDFYALREKYIPEDLRSDTPLEDPHFLAIDFGMCVGDNGKIVPQLIELQAFPSLFLYQNYLGAAYRKFYPAVPIDRFDYLFSEMTAPAYLEKMRRVILGPQPAENVILLELFPEKQKTRIDFWATKKALGIEVVCVTRILKEGRQLFYEKDGKKVRIRRIYNRLIQDDLLQYPDLELPFRFNEDLDVNWISHPDWFNLISKSIMPRLQHEYIPTSYYLDERPGNLDLQNYVLKPLFSFAGKGVELNPTESMLAAIRDKQNYILQQKVEYAPLVKCPDGSYSKVELRILYAKEDEEEHLQPVINLARMGKGKLINVSHATDATWIGSSVCYFES